MELIRRVLVVAALGAPAVLEIACDDDPPAAAATHACPMHPNRTGRAGDKCPDCGMDLVPR